MKDFNHFNNIKGALAESIIEQLFLSEGYKVYRFGMEKSHPEILDAVRKGSGKLPEEIRRMADFVVLSPVSNQFHFIEVTFRKDGCFQYKDLKGDYPYPGAFIIVVSKTSIRCLTAEELKKGKSIHPDSENHLVDRPEFRFSKKKIIEFCNYAKLLYSKAA